MNSLNTIQVRPFFNSSDLHSREQARRLINIAGNYIQKEIPVDVNFYGVDFISRSFADELVNLTYSMKDSYLIYLCCMNDDVRKMIEAVQNTQKGSNTHYNLRVQRFDNMENLLNYFSE